MPGRFPSFCPFLSLPLPSSLLCLFAAPVSPPFSSSVVRSPCSSSPVCLSSCVFLVSPAPAPVSSAAPGVLLHLAFGFDLCPFFCPLPPLTRLPFVLVGPTTVRGLPGASPFLSLSCCRRSSSCAVFPLSSPCSLVSALLSLVLRSPFRVSRLLLVSIVSPSPAGSLVWFPPVVCSRGSVFVAFVLCSCPWSLPPPRSCPDSPGPLGLIPRFHSRSPVGVRSFLFALGSLPSLLVFSVGLFPLVSVALALALLRGSPCSSPRQRLLPPGPLSALASRPHPSGRLSPVCSGPSLPPGRSSSVPASRIFPSLLSAPLVCPPFVLFCSVRAPLCSSPVLPFLLFFRYLSLSPPCCPSLRFLFLFPSFVPLAFFPLFLLPSALSLSSLPFLLSSPRRFFHFSPRSSLLPSFRLASSPFPSWLPSFRLLLSPSPSGSFSPVPPMSFSASFPPGPFLSPVSSSRLPAVLSPLLLPGRWRFEFSLFQPWSCPFSSFFPSIPLARPLPSSLPSSSFSSAPRSFYLPSAPVLSLLVRSFVALRFLPSCRLPSFAFPYLRVSALLCPSPASLLSSLPSFAALVRPCASGASLLSLLRASSLVPSSDPSAPFPPTRLLLSWLVALSSLLLFSRPLLALVSRALCFSIFLPHSRLAPFARLLYCVFFPLLPCACRPAPVPVLSPSPCCPLLSRCAALFCLPFPPSPPVLFSRSPLPRACYFVRLFRRRLSSGGFRAPSASLRFLWAPSLRSLFPCPWSFRLLLVSSPRLLPFLRRLPATVPSCRPSRRVRSFAVPGPRGLVRFSPAPFACPLPLARSFGSLFCLCPLGTHALAL